MTDKGIITLTAEKEDDFVISISDLTGRKVFEKQLLKTKQATIELKAFQNKSMYIVKVENSKNQVVIKKLLQK